MAKHIKFQVPVYQSDVWVVIDEQEASRLAWQKCGVDSCDDFSMCGATFYGRDNNVVWLPVDCGIRTLAHECMHVVLNICHRRGIIADTNNQEPVAYLMGHVTHAVMSAHIKLKDSLK